MKTTLYRTSDYLKTQKDRIMYLNVALEDDEPIILLDAIRNVAQSKNGTGVLAKAVGMSRKNLDRALSRRSSPKIEMVIKLLKALGFKLMVESSKSR